MPRGVAARVEGWQRRLGRWPGTPTPASTPDAAAFPQAPLDVSVAIWVDESWIDVTPYVFGGERAIIDITRARPNEGAGTPDPSRASFQLNNRDGQFSPRNPLSWLYGKIGRNTKVRVMVGADYRFTGEISEWPQRWDVSGRDIWVPVEAAGIIRRLSQGATPFKSTMLRGYLTLDHQPIAYWPAEDEEGSITLASGLSGGSPMTLIGDADLATNTDFRSSFPLPVVTDSEWSGRIPNYSLTGEMQLFLLLSIPTAGATNGEIIWNLYESGTVRRWALIYGTGGTLNLKGYDRDNVEVEASGAIAFNVNGAPERISVSFEQNGADVDWEIIGQTLDGNVGGLGGTFTGQTLGVATRVLINPGGGLGDGIAFGHVSFHDEVRSPYDLKNEFTAYFREEAADRLQRLCDEEGVEFVLRDAPDPGDSAAMGHQLPKTLMELLTECAETDGGILYEPRDRLGLAYRTRRSMYSQPAAVTLDYTAKHLGPPSPEPTDDDQQTRNDVTVRRDGGSSSRATKETGALSTQMPPDGVGRYDEEVTLSVGGDGLAAFHAGWRVFLGTVDEARYPHLSVELSRQPFTDTPDLAAALRALDAGDRLVVENPPAWLPPDDISQLALGFSERLGTFEHGITVNCAPARPWAAVGHTYDGDVARYESQGTSLTAGVDSTATSLVVAVLGPVWTDADGDFDVLVAGERMTITAISGASSPQTFTATRSVNGVVKSHTAGAAVALAEPTVYAL